MTTGRRHLLPPLAAGSALVLASLAALLALQAGQPDAADAPFAQGAAGTGVAAAQVDAASFGRVARLQAEVPARRAEGDTRAAERALAESSAILRELRTRAPFDPEVLRLLGIDAYWLGQLAKDRNDLPAATRHWRSYLELSGQLSRLQPNNPEWWIERSYGLNNLGSLAVARAEWTRAAHAFTGSIALKERAFRERPGDAGLAAELADSYSWLGLAREALGQLDAASALYAREMTLLARLRGAAPQDTTWIEREARALQRRAALAKVSGRDDEALADYRRAAQHFVTITGAHPANRAWQVEQASVALRIEALLARAQRHAGPSAAAAASARLATLHARLERIGQLDPAKRIWSQAEAVARANLARALLREGRDSEAGRHARASVSRLEALIASGGSNVNLQAATMDSLLQLAEIESVLGRPAAARAACAHAHALIEDTAAASMDHRVLDPWVRIKLCLGEGEGAREAARRLHAIGYRDRDYLAFSAGRM